MFQNKIIHVPSKQILTSVEAYLIEVATGDLHTPQLCLDTAASTFTISSVRVESQFAIVPRRISKPGWQISACRAAPWAAAKISKAWRRRTLTASRCSCPCTEVRLNVYGPSLMRGFQHVPPVDTDTRARGECFWLVSIYNRDLNRFKIIHREVVVKSRFARWGGCTCHDKCAKALGPKQVSPPSEADCVYEESFCPCRIGAAQMRFLQRDLTCTVCFRV
jgi:hypothetical protein